MCRTKVVQSHTKRACVHCKRAKVRCVGELPCERCVRLNLENTCLEAECGKRGRKPRKIVEDAHNGTDGGDTTSKRAKLASSSSAPVEMDASLLFALLLGHLCGWNDETKRNGRRGGGRGSDSSPGQALTWFARFCRTEVHRYLHGRESAPAMMNQAMITNLLTVVDTIDVPNAAATAAAAAAVTRNRRASLSSLSSSSPAHTHTYTKKTHMSPVAVLMHDVSRYVYNQMPLGIMVFPLTGTDGEVYANQWAASLLDYKDVGDLCVAMTNGTVFGFLHHASYSTYVAEFVDSIRRHHRVEGGDCDFSMNLQLVCNGGEEVCNVLANCRVSFDSREPSEVYMFIQRFDRVVAPPTTVPVPSPLPSSSSSVATPPLVLPSVPTPVPWRQDYATETLVPLFGWNDERM